MNRASVCSICEGVLNEYNLKVVSSPLSVPCQACFKILEPHQTNKLIRMRMHMHVTTTITKCSILSRILSNTQQFTRVRVYLCISTVSFGCMKRMYRTWRVPYLNIISYKKLEIASKDNESKELSLKSPTSCGAEVEECGRDMQVLRFRSQKVWAMFPASNSLLPCVLS